MREDRFQNLVWDALHSTHAHLALGNKAAVSYPADIAPFAALADEHHRDLTPLEPLIAKGHLVYLVGAEPQATKSLRVGTIVPCFQMFLEPQRAAEPPAGARDSHSDAAADDGTGILRLTAADAPDMVALTDLAFPGFFRARTYVMGTYYGIRMDGQLIAMTGERLAANEYREISAVCTHPAFTGKGFAKRLMRRLIHDHVGTGLKSFLHVRTNNGRAIAIYERMGFVSKRTVSVWPVTRTS